MSSRTRAFRLPKGTLPEKTTPEVKRKRTILLNRLKIQHKTPQEVYYLLGEWERTQALLDRLVEQQKIEFVDGKYRPYGWQSPRPRGYCFKTCLTIREAV